jgi:deoxyhypusine synthase
MPKEAPDSHKVPVKDYEFTENMPVDELVKQMEAAWGFTAGKLATGVTSLKPRLRQEMLKILLPQLTSSPPQEGHP